MKKRLAIILAIIMLVSNLGSALAAPPESINHNPIAGENGYVSLHSYVSPTDIANVYKVEQEIQGRIDPTSVPVDIVLLFDNTRSMVNPDPNRLAGAKDSAKQMIDMFYNPADPDFIGIPEAANIALVQFGARGEAGNLGFPPPI